MPEYNCPEDEVPKPGHVWGLEEVNVGLSDSGPESVPENSAASWGFTVEGAREAVLSGGCSGTCRGSSSIILNLVLTLVSILTKILASSY